MGRYDLLVDVDKTFPKWQIIPFKRSLIWDWRCIKTPTVRTKPNFPNISLFSSFPCLLFSFQSTHCFRFVLVLCLLSSFQPLSSKTCCWFTSKLPLLWVIWYLFNRDMIFGEQTFILRTGIRDVKMTAISAKLFYWIIFLWKKIFLSAGCPWDREARYSDKVRLYPPIITGHYIDRNSTERNRRYESNKPNKWALV